MSIIFESTVKSKDDGSWYIELKDTILEKTEICQNLKEYEETIQKMAEEYGGRIDEVKWISDGLSPEQMQEVRIAMMKYHEKYKDEIEKDLEE